jgi:hypothetical protein
MTTPHDDRSPDDPDGAGETGALAAASRDEPEAGDPLGPLNRLTEDEDS